MIISEKVTSAPNSPSHRGLEAGDPGSKFGAMMFSSVFFVLAFLVLAELLTVLFRR
jgi:hypothetical protein